MISTDDGGLIPAGAGRTTRPAAPELPQEAHPRWRGEDDLRRDAEGLPQGSSPLARGGQDARPVLEAYQGLIPAGAGRTG